MKKPLDIIAYVVLALLVWVIISTLIVNNINVHYFVMTFIYMVLFVGVYQYIAKERVIKSKRIIAIISLINAFVIVLLLYFRFVSEDILMHPLVFIFIVLIYYLLFTQLVFYIGKKMKKQRKVKGK